MTTALEEYRALRSALEDLRWAKLGHDSPEEDALLDSMDRVWERLTEAEIALVESDPPIVAPRAPLAAPHREGG